MNIDKEISKYEKKKANLLSALVARLTGYANSKRRSIENIDSTMTDLYDQKAVSQEELDVVNKKLKELK